jgi:hypothetical protein
MTTFLILFPFVFSALFIGVQASSYALRKKTKNKMEKPPATIKEQSLDELIAATKGKFFSVTFVKKNGSIRVVNGKDKYHRLLVRGQSPQVINGQSEFSNFFIEDKSKIKENVPFVDRNKKSILDKRGGGWVSTKNDSVITFKCGNIVKEFHA